MVHLEAVGEDTDGGLPVSSPATFTAESIFKQLLIKKIYLETKQKAGVSVSAVSFVPNAKEKQMLTGTDFAEKVKEVVRHRGYQSKNDRAVSRFYCCFDS